MDLSDAVAKVEHARGHLERSADLINSWISGGGLRQEYFDDVAIACAGWSLVVDTPVPREALLSLGDFFANLRDALDFVAWQIYLDGSPGTGTPSIYFPILRPGVPWTNTKKIPNASPRNLALLRAAQDEPPESLLYPLSKLAASQKHNRLFMAARSSTLWEARMRLPEGVPEGLGVSMTVPAERTTLSPGARVDLVTVTLVADNDPAAEAIDRPANFTFGGVPLPEYSLAVTDGVGEFDLHYLPRLGNKVEDVVKSFH